MYVRLYLKITEKTRKKDLDSLRKRIIDTMKNDAYTRQVGRYASVEIKADGIMVELVTNDPLRGLPTYLRNEITEL